MKRMCERGRSGQRSEQGIALVPTMLVVSGLAIFTMALMTGVLSNNRTVVHQSDEYQLSSSVESVGTLAVESIWSAYLDDQGGFAGSIASFRTFLDNLGIAPDAGTQPPGANEGFDWMNNTQLAGDGTEFQGIGVDSVRIVRRDVLSDASQLFVTVTAHTDRGGDAATPRLNRAIQMVYTIEPSDFEGFEYAMLANNVNCIFCHTQVDSAERYFDLGQFDFDGDGNPDGVDLNNDSYYDYERARVGTLESLMIRHNMDGITTAVNDADTNSLVAGTIYTRGGVLMHDGTPVSPSDWSDLTFKAYETWDDGDKAYILEDNFGLSIQDLAPGAVGEQFKNFYENYPTTQAAMWDGNLPTSFPAPIPDNGGKDPLTGLPDPAAIGNRLVDDAEFYDLASSARGSVSVAKPVGVPAGALNVSPSGDTLNDIVEYATALFVGNQTNINDSVSGNVIMTGTASDPIVLDGTVAIDGDLIINGYVKGEGSLVVRGNIYIPTDLQYLDGSQVDADGDPHRTFGVASDGTTNALGLTAGGNIIMGDFLRPSSLKYDKTYVVPPASQMITGNPDTGDPMVDLWSFSLAEMSLFNRGEWAKTQEYLPADAAEAALPAGSWTAANPNYVADYVPRYYGHGDDTIIPIYNKNVWYDVATQSWHGTEEVPTGWDASLLTYVDPTDPSDPYLFDSSGDPIAVNYSLKPQGEWVPDDFYKLTVNVFQSTGYRPLGKAMSIDGLLYTNNAIFGIVQRATTFYGRMVVNGSLVAADLGMLVPGFEDPTNFLRTNIPNSDFATGLQLNYDERVKDLLDIRNGTRVQLKRTLWNPTANLQ